MDYLKDKQYYEDLYDLHTIESCFDWIKLAVKKCDTDKDFQKISKKEQIRGKNILVELPIYFKKGERYRNKEKTINEWMEKDRVKQEKLDNSKEPKNIFCEKCNWEMQSTTKSLYDFTDESLRVLFFFECPNCHKRKGIFDNGDEFIGKPKLCPKCGNEFKTSYKNNKNISTYIEECKKCNFKSEDKTDFKALDEKTKRKRTKTENSTG